jgi:hypothetical protein
MGSIEAKSWQVQVHCLNEPARLELALHQDVAADSDALAIDHGFDRVEFLTESQTFRFDWVGKLRINPPSRLYPTAPGRRSGFRRLPTHVNKRFAEKLCGAHRLLALIQEDRAADRPKSVTHYFAGNEPGRGGPGIANRDVGLSRVKVHNLIGPDHVKWPIGIQCLPDA